MEPMTPPAMVPAGGDGFGGDEDEEEEEEEEGLDVVGLGLLLLDVGLTFAVRVVALVARLDVAGPRFNVTVVAADEIVVVDVVSESEAARNPNAIGEVEAPAVLVGERESEVVGREVGCWSAVPVGGNATPEPLPGTPATASAVLAAAPCTTVWVTVTVTVVPVPHESAIVISDTSLQLQVLEGVFSTWKLVYSRGSKEDFDNAFCQSASRVGVCFCVLQRSRASESYLPAPTASTMAFILSFSQSWRGRAKIFPVDKQWDKETLEIAARAVGKQTLATQ